MKEPENAAISFMRWCARQNWDALLMLFVGPDATATETDRHFAEFIEEVERAIGTPEFRWIRFVPRNEEEVPPAFFLLVGGTGSDDLSAWGRRWSAISGRPRGRRGPVFSSGRQPQRLLSMVRMLRAQATDYDIEVRIGSRLIAREWRQAMKDQD